MAATNLPNFLKCGNAENHRYLSCFGKMAIAPYLAVILYTTEPYAAEAFCELIHKF